MRTTFKHSVDFAKIYERSTGWPYRSVEASDPAARNDAQEDPKALGRSINDYVADLAVHRDGRSAAGLVLLLPRTGLTVVPVHFCHPADGYPGRGYWTVVVVAGSPRYKVGGYDLSVGSEEIAAGIEVALPEVAAPAEDEPVHRFASLSTGRLLKLDNGVVVLCWRERSPYDYPGTKSAMECIVVEGASKHRTGDLLAISHPVIETAALVTL